MTSLPCVAGAAFVAVLQAVDCRLRGRSHLREARRAFRRVACAMTRASACGSSWLSVESRRVALATIATPSRADAPRRRPVAAVRHAIAAEAPATHWAGRQKARAALASATRLMSESDGPCLVRRLRCRVCCRDFTLFVVERLYIALQRRQFVTRRM